MKPVLVRRPIARLDATGLSRVLPEIQSLIDASRQHVVSTANLTLVWLYWNVGRVVTEDIQKIRSGPVTASNSFVVWPECSSADTAAVTRPAT